MCFNHKKNQCYFDIANIQIKPSCVTNWLCSESKKKDLCQDTFFLRNNSRKFVNWIDILSCEKATIEKKEERRYFYENKTLYIHHHL